MRYVREPDAITVALRVTTRIRSSTQVTLIWRWMGLGLSRRTVATECTLTSARQRFYFGR